MAISHGTGARFGWGMRTPADITRLDPGLELVERRSGAALAREVGLPWFVPAIVRIVGALTCLLYRFL